MSTWPNASATSRSLPVAGLLASLLLAGCATNPRSTDEAVAIPAAAANVTTETTEPVSAPAAPGPDYSAMRLSVAGVGDMMLGSDYPDNRLPANDGATFLAAVTPVLSSADIAFGNLEGVLMDGGEPVKTCKDPSACYLFRSPTRYAQHLRAAGFDVMSLANNHARDFGEAGRDSSMAALDAVDILHSGRTGDIASWVQNDLRIALIAFSPTAGAWPLLEIDTAAAAVSELAAAHDLVIVSFHGGAEGIAGAERLGFGMEYAYGEPRGNVVAFSRAVIDAGADLVIGHGPHVPRAMEIYNERLIAYSLGNFATYLGIGVTGTKGYAPVLVAELDGYGRFVSGQLLSFIQQRPGGPVADSQQRALRMIRELSLLDFPDGQLDIGADGQLGYRR